MKGFKMNTTKISRNTFIFTLWTLVYFAWFRWFMLINWDFNIFLAEHWQFIARQWWYGGWVIEGSYYWIFIISLFLCIPFWIFGLCFLLSIPYSKYFEKAFWDSIYKRKTKVIQKNDSKIRIKKKKSYKEIRPKPLAGTPQFVAPLDANKNSLSSNTTETADLFMKEASSKSSDSFSHREIKDDFEGTSPFEMENTADNSVLDLSQTTTIQPVKEDFTDIMHTAGATVIQNVHLDDQKMDYVAIAKDSIFFIKTDAEKGDWLADEERFNDEDPLWFSETSHRVSPITLLRNFKKSATEKLQAVGINLESHIILVKTDGNIINAEDMQDTWKQMDVLVVRSNLGMPEELALFGESFPKSLTPQDASQIEKIKAVFEI